jgi:hypothetical protein
VIGVLDDGFVIEEINPAHREALAGLGLELAPGARLEEQLSPAVAEVIAANYRRVIETDQLQSYRESATWAARSPITIRCWCRCVTRRDASFAS